MENFKPSMQERVKEMIASRPIEKRPASTPDQIEAAKMLEMEAQRREERKQNDKTRIEELQHEIKNNPKIELDLSNLEGAVINEERHGAVGAKEGKWGEVGPDEKLAA